MAASIDIAEPRCIGSRNHLVPNWLLTKTTAAQEDFIDDFNDSCGHNHALMQ
jgi:hypothetical protein